MYNFLRKLSPFEPCVAGAIAQRPELQNKVLELQGGRAAAISDPESGLLLPQYPEAVSWLQAFWTTGKPRPWNGGDSTRGGQQQHWYSSTSSTSQKGEPTSAPDPNNGALSTYPTRHWWNRLFAEEPAMENGRGTGVAKDQFVCGQPVGKGPIHRSNLLIVPAGDSWNAEKYVHYIPYVVLLTKKLIFLIHFG